MWEQICWFAWTSGHHSTEYNGVPGMILIILFCIDTFGIPYLNWAVLLGYKLWEVFDIAREKTWLHWSNIHTGQIRPWLFHLETYNEQIDSPSSYCCLRSTSGVLLEVKMARLECWIDDVTDKQWR